jgi:SMI1-KNR4 cell-wall
MKKIEWKECLKIPVATDEDIHQMENQLKILFPEEFKQILKLAQGKSPIPKLVELGENHTALFRAIFHVLPEECSGYSIKRTKETWDEYFPCLLPIADAGDSCFFAYDLRQESENPPVVFINSDADPDDENESIIFVASSLTELLSNLKDQPLEPFSVEALIEAIDEHPLRWEVITLESALSLPTLSVQNSKTYCEFFFYPMGGPIDNQTIWPPYYRVISPIDNLDSIEYEAILPNELSAIISPDKPLGIATLEAGSWSEYETQLKILYALADRLLEIYPNPAVSQSKENRKVITDFRQIFHQLIQQPLLPAYKAFNPEFFQWLEKTCD